MLTDFPSLSSFSRIVRFEDLQYQRLIIGYHGCDESVRDRVILRKQSLKPSSNDYDWLGEGIYFWEHGPERAMAWAEEQYQHQRGKIEKPAVVGSVIHLGRCFDLLDTRYTTQLREIFPTFKSKLQASGQDIPRNSSDPESLWRRRDCAVLNWTMEVLKEMMPPFQTVRGVFQEGEAAYDGSSIRLKSHIQIAIRDQDCILGYFVPPLGRGDDQ